MFKFIIFLFIGLSVFSGEGTTLSLKDIHSTMDKMFRYHVENREFSPMLAKRSLKIYIAQFDPDRIYLLKSEVEPYLSMPPSQMQVLIHHYHQGQFLEYKNVNFMVQGAIQRARQIRYQQIKRLMSEGKEAFQCRVPSSYSAYPSDEEELKNRIYERLILEVQSHLRSRKDETITPQLLRTILEYRSKKVACMEEEYLDDTEHFLTCHILKAIAKGLDPHTGYYSPREAYEIRTMLRKEFSGVGIVFREDFDGIYLADFALNGPALKSESLRVGDRLISVNGQKVDALSFKEFLEIMKGPAGSKVTLEVQRGEEVIQSSLIREKISMDDERVVFSHEPCGEGIIGKVTVPAFYDNGGKISAFHDLKEALRALKREGELKGIVLDFRENSGGFLSQAVKVSSLFMNGGLIVISKYADGEVRYMRNVDGRQFFDGPILILISKASASAAEIVAQALQDYGVALIVGDERSYGKGTMQMQTITDDQARSFFKVTVGRYYTASGRSPQIQGVQGDILVPTAFFSYNLGEKYLEFPLANDCLSGDLCRSLLNTKGESYRDLPFSVIPYLKPRDTVWRQMIPSLIKNSKKRIERNRNYQVFLKGKKEGTRQGLAKENHGINDLQLQESVEILKDMIALDRAEISKSRLR